MDPHLFIGENESAISCVREILTVYLLLEVAAAEPNKNEQFPLQILLG